MKEPKQVRLIDMPLDQQREVFTKAAFDGMIRRGLGGLEDNLNSLLITLHNQREDDNKKRPRRALKGK